MILREIKRNVTGVRGETWKAKERRRKCGSGEKVVVAKDDRRSIIPGPLLIRARVGH